MIKATINGLIEGISVVEKDNNTNNFPLSDMLFNDKEPADLKGLYYDEFVAPESEYRVEDFGESINLTSNLENNFSMMSTQVDEHGFKLNY
jgi:hypothetical protein